VALPWHCAAGGQQQCDDSDDAKVRCAAAAQWSAAPDATDEERDEAEARAGSRIDASLRPDVLGRYAGHGGPSGYQHEFGHADPDSDSDGDGSDASLSDRSV